MRRVQDQHPLDPIGVDETEQDRGPATPVVADHERALDPERVEQRDLVGGERLAVVAVPRRLAPAEAAQVRSDQPIFVPQGADHPPPHVPVLWPAVKEEDRRLAEPLGPRFGDVDSHPVGLDEAVLDAVDVRELGAHAAHSSCRARAFLSARRRVAWAGGQGAAEEPSGAIVRGARPAGSGARGPRRVAARSAHRPGPAPDRPRGAARDAVLSRLSARNVRSSGLPRLMRSVGARPVAVALQAGAGCGSAEPPPPVRGRRGERGRDRAPGRALGPARVRALLPPREAAVLAPRDGRPDQAVQALRLRSAGAPKGPPDARRDAPRAPAGRAL